MNIAGMTVSAGILNAKYVDGIRDTFEYKESLIPKSAHTDYNPFVYGFDPDSEYMKATTKFLAKHYAGKQDNLHISYWVVGDEVNDEGCYNYMGGISFEQLVQSYYNTFKCISDAVKENNPDNKVYVCLNHVWTKTNGNGSNNHKGKDFLQSFNAKAANMDWGVAFYPYSFPLDESVV